MLNHERFLFILTNLFCQLCFQILMWTELPVMSSTDIWFTILRRLLVYASISIRH